MSNQNRIRLELTEEEFNKKYQPYTNEIKYPFTTLYKSKEGTYIKKRIIQGKQKDYFLEEIRKEIDIQIRLQNSNHIMTINNFTIFKRNNQNIIIIAYSTDEYCVPLLDYTQCLHNNDGLIDRKIKLSLSLLEIYQELLTNQIWHQNIKPNNVFYFDGEILISDFGSNRTFNQNYFQQFNQRQEQKWQLEYYFYNPKIILDIIQNDLDYDIRQEAINEVKEEIQKLQQIENVLNVTQNSFNLDAWAIGIIIIQIFFPQKIDTQNIRSFYALNAQKLNDKIKEITQIDNQLGQGLENLFYPKQQIKQASVNINRSLVLTGQIKALEQSPIIPEITIQLGPRNEERKKIVATYEATQMMDKFLLSLQNKIHPKLANYLQVQDQDAKSQLILDFNVILQLDLTEVQSYLDELRNQLRKFEDEYKKLDEEQRKTDKINNILKHVKQSIEKFEHHIFLVENRLLALQYYYNYEMEPPEENIIYYYNLKELTMIQWRKQFQITYEQQKKNKNYQQQQHFSSIKINNLIKLRQKELKLEAQLSVKINRQDQELVSIYYLEKCSNKDEIIYKKKMQQKDQQYGVEQFSFNLSLKTRRKVDDFINKKQPEYLLDFDEYNSISTKIKNNYLKALFNCLDDRIKSNVEQKEINQFIRGINQIYPQLKFKLKQKYTIVNLQQGMLPSELCKEISSLFEQKYSVIMKVDSLYFEYLKQFDDIQIIKNYTGFLINGKPHGQGFRRINENTLQFGIFKYGKLIWGWEIVKVDNKILYYKGEFQNDKKYGKGVHKIFQIREVELNSFFTKIEESV